MARANASLLKHTLKGNELSPTCNTTTMSTKNSEVSRKEKIDPRVNNVTNHAHLTVHKRPKERESGTRMPFYATVSVSLDSNSAPYRSLEDFETVPNTLLTSIVRKPGV